ncbi:uncharacterized protein [Medicago truncatula]|uniref:uncharacterized protein isoform X2 n=1 Tax=Medicago truncatula TaxID=3880 RepID=UPI0019682FDF|nr:uncharacterized protein LOC25479472 isoform X2 [Medicago truncatula]
MEILISVVAKIAEYTVVPFGRQASYLIFYKGNFKTLKDNVEDLEATRERMNHLVEGETQNGKVIEKDVLNWLDKVNEVIEKANGLQNDPRNANVSCSAWPFPNLILRHQLSRKATKIAKDVVQVQGKGIFDQVGYLPPLDVVASSSTRDREKYDTRESLKEDIVKALADSTCNIGVYGLGGVGKTTLVEKVAQIAKEHKLFDRVVETEVSKNQDIKRIQGEIADSLGLRLEEETNRGRAERLRQRIKMEKSILIILDNIWTILVLKEVGIPVGDEHNGCKLLMTSRDQEVLLQMDVPKEFTFKVELMSENETWSLFQFMAGDVVKDSNLKDLPFQVARKCEGLPLRVVIVARAMKNKRDVQLWKDALRKLQSNDHIEMDPGTYSALELSYNSLESDEMRALFLLFALMLCESIEYFLKVSMGLDILKHINVIDNARNDMDDARNVIDDARNRLYTIIKSLEARCLLLEVKTDGIIQMHDFVRDFAISVARRDKHLLLREQSDKEWPHKDFFERCTQIVLYRCDMHEIPQTIDCPNIKLFILFSKNQSLEIPDTFFKGMRSLRVLDLTYLNLLSLPTSFRLLKDLQTLCLDQCILENMDALEALQNLEILSLLKSSMIKLPREIGRLTQLRMLDLSHSGIEVVPPNIISSLTKLEELYMGNTSINWQDVNLTVQNENASIAELRKLSNLKALELQIRETWMLPRDLQLVFEKLERYKIAIGDVWDWSDIKDGTLKTLMLKLGTNIHLEHGIKALIKGVENLYLDDVDGIQNVLPHLNREGFTLLKHLHVQNNTNLNHIVDNKERNQIHASFPMLETLVLLNLRNLEHICHGQPSVASFGSLSVIKVKNCVQLKYLFSFTMVKGLSHLCKIEVCECNSMKEIVFRDNNSSANNDITDEKIEFLQLRSLTLEHLETLDNFTSDYLTHHRSKEKYQGLEPYAYTTPFFNAQVAFSNLDTLKLSSLLNLNQIWDDNHQSMCNLTSLIVDNCVGLKYLFSSSLVESFMNLRHLEISNCHMMEEIIAKNDGNNALREVHFLKLEKIILKDMDNLKTIWHHQFETSKMLEVNNCKKIVVVFPSSLQNTYNELEKLEVKNCALVEEIFELTFNQNNSEEVMTQLKEVTLDGLLKLKKIWSGDPQGILSFQNLINVQLKGCARLEYLLPLSVATRCSHLKELWIRDCYNMKQIVAEEKESSVNAAPIFEFNQLSTLLLWSLYKLNGFYAGNHTLACPSLRNINVARCTKLKLFTTLSTRSSNFRDGKHSVLTKQPLFIAEEVIPNLEALRMGQADADMILQTQNSSSLFSKMTVIGLSDYESEEARFPYWFLENVHTLESLVVQWSCFKKIFQDKGEITEKTHPHIKRLSLNQLPKLQHICEEGSQIDPVLEFLEHLVVDSCSSLINLMPSSVTLNHLRRLEIIKCNGLKYLITTPTARSLDKLTVLKIKDCNSLDEVVTGVENVDIAFMSLQILMLECLPSLIKFCSIKCFMKFPSLEKVIVGECPRMKIFSAGNTSTPILRKVKIAEIDSEWHWKGNLNDTIYNMFQDKVGFGSFKHLKLSEYPDLKEFWYGRLEHKAFRSLKHLVVHKCDFLSDVLFQPNLVGVLMNLEELDVKDCNSLEAVFDLKGEFTEEIAVQNSTQLKKLKLFNLPKLKHVWKEDPHYTMRFENLSDVSVVDCKSLISLFPFSVARDMMQLQSLRVRSCGIQEIVKEEEATKEIVKFVFLQLTSIILQYLPKLKAFFVGAHSLQCKSLKTINLFGCPKIELFKAEPLRHRESSNNDELNISTNQPLFVIEEFLQQVLANVENLHLNDKDFGMILQSQYSGVQFNNIKHISVCEFYNEEATFPYWFLKDVPNLETLLVEWSSFTEIFQGEQIIRTEKEPEIIPQLRKLTLRNLTRLQCICKEGVQIDPVLHFVKSIRVHQCSSLIMLVPSSVTFSYMTNLEVTNCNGLKNLITHSTAKSLVKLTTMKIKMCNWLEDIVNGKEDETNEIVFCSLQILELISLQRLCRFCSCPCPIKFPLLEVVVVKECPRMELFSLGVANTTNLQNVQTDEGNHWEGDLNRTIKKMFCDKVGFGSFKHLKLSEYPELKEFWYGQLEHNAYRSLKHLVVHKCGFLSDVLFQPNLLEVLMNLKELDVEDCNSLEAVFDLKDEFAKEIVVQNSSQLKKLKLSNLPKLRHVWKEDPHNTMRFQNLSDVSVVGCNSLISLFPLSVARDLMQLQSLQVIKCGIQEIVAKEEGTDEMVKFVFPHLTFIKLNNLTKLKAFFVGVHSLQCKSLKTINLFGCPKIELFKAETLRHQESSRNDVLNISTYQPLFVNEDVLANVESLSLNKKDFGMILKSQYSRVQFNNIKHITVCEFYNEEATFPYWFLKDVPNLETLLVEWSSFMEIFQGEQIIRTEKEPEIIPQLRKLTLWNLTRLQCICKEGVQIDPVLHFLESIWVYQCSSLIMLVPSSVTFSYMTNLEVTNCNGLKNLITHSTAKSLVKLTIMKIKMCNWLEDIVNGKEDETNEIVFCSLQTLELISSQRLCRFCSCPCPIKFPLLEVVVVKECPRMELFSLGVTNTTNLQNVQTDEGNHWEGDLNRTIKKMFCDKVGFGSFKHLKLTEYPELKELWYGQLEHNAFRSLKHLVVHKCDFLSNVLFQPNLVGVLMNLEKLDVKNCNSLEAVFDLKGEFTEEIAVQNSTQLKKLKLSNLPKLKHVWKEDPHYTMRFQNLSVVSVADCKSLISLFPLSVARDMMQLQSLLVSNCGIEEIVVKEEGPDEMVKFVFPHLTSIELDNLTKLKAFFVGVHSLQCKSLKTIKLFKCPRIELFKAEPLKLQESSKNVEQNISTYQPLFVFEEELLTSVESTPQFRELELLQLHKLKYICKEGFQMDPFLHFLESIDVCQCSSLIKLVPSSVTFSYMTYLEVTNCNGLINLITHSTAKSLVKLTTMKIEMCNWLEDIVNGKEDETNEIVFCSLQTLELISLQRLIRFCSCPCPIMFPLLEVVVVKECPRMELFSLGVTNTTNLQNVQTDEENHREGDLNRTIKKMFFDKVAFGEFKYLALSDYPEIKDLWYGQLHHNMFCNLKHLVVERCDFLSHVLFPSNVMQVLQTLEELEVKDCDSLEAVFDVKGMKSQKIMIKQSTQLKRLTVSSLPKLKHIWNEDPHEIISFGNLCTVDVSMCQSLLYIFPYSLCLDLGHLEMLKIESCGVKEIVSMEETGSMDINFNFPQLKVMILYHLNNLKSFYQGKHTLDFPSLKTLNVYRCEALRMFSFNNSDLQQPYSVDENQDMLYQQPLFCIEKLSPNLEELALNGKDMLGILNGYCQENIFHKVKFLRLQCFNETPTILLNDFHTIFPNVETFQVRNSSFETLFPTKGARSYLSMQMSNQIRKMWLFELDKLKHIWQEDFPLDHHLLQYLEELHVVNCPSLISLVPSSTSFTNLTHLKVDNCEELIYLIKISTAKSLVQLKALNITNCEKMLDVVNIDDDKAEENIIFENLEYLEFTSLSNLRSFCYGKQTFIFPSLLRFIFKGCPQMKIFSSALTVAPCLTSIEVEEENMRWKGDLNTTIEQMFIEKEVPPSN